MWACAPVPCVAAGTTPSRRWLTSADVFGSCGEVRGMTVIVAASPARLTTGAATAATSGAALAPACSFWSAASAAGLVVGERDGDRAAGR